MQIYAPLEIHLGPEVSAWERVCVCVLTERTRSRQRCVWVCLGSSNSWGFVSVSDKLDAVSEFALWQHVPPTVRCGVASELLSSVAFFKSRTTGVKSLFFFFSLGDNRAGFRINPTRSRHAGEIKTFAFKLPFYFKWNYPYANWDWMQRKSLCGK